MAKRLSDPGCLGKPRDMLISKIVLTQGWAWPFPKRVTLTYFCSSYISLGDPWKCIVQKTFLFSILCTCVPIYWLFQKKTFPIAWSCPVTTLVCVQNPSPCRFFLIQGKLAQDCLLNPTFRGEGPWVAPSRSKKPCLALAIIYDGALSSVGRVNFMCRYVCTCACAHENEKTTFCVVPLALFTFF